MRSYNLLSSFSFFNPGLKEIIMLLVFFLIGNIIASIIMFFGAMTLGTDVALTYGMPILYPLIFIPGMIYASVKSTKASFEGQTAIPVDQNNFGAVGGLMAAVMVALSTIAMSVVVDPIGNLLPEMSPEIEESMNRLMHGPLWLSLLTTAVFAPFFEEWLCRGMILRGLLQRIKPVWAILISGLIFGVIHGNIWQAIPATIIGSFFGYVYYKTGSLKLTMLMHCANNALAVILGNIDSLKDIEHYAEMFPQTWMWILFYVMCAAVLVLFFATFSKKIPPLAKPEETGIENI